MPGKRRTRVDARTRIGAPARPARMRPRPPCGRRHDEMGSLGRPFRGAPTRGRHSHAQKLGNQTVFGRCPGIVCGEKTIRRASSKTMYFETECRLQVFSHTRALMAEAPRRCCCAHWMAGGVATFKASVASPRTRGRHRSRKRAIAPPHSEPLLARNAKLGQANSAGRSFATGSLCLTPAALLDFVHATAASRSNSAPLPFDRISASRRTGSVGDHVKTADCLAPRKRSVFRLSFFSSLGSSP